LDDFAESCRQSDLTPIICPICGDEGDCSLDLIAEHIHRLFLISLSWSRKTPPSDGWEDSEKGGTETSAVRDPPVIVPPCGDRRVARSDSNSGDAIIKNPNRCKSCQMIDTKLRRRLAEAKKVQRWRSEGSRLEALIQRSLEIIEDLDKGISQLLIEHQRTNQAIGKIY
jgi:hypothetical protein